MIAAGDRVRFQASLVNGGSARWTSVVVSVEDGIAKVRHPKIARSFPFSPVPQARLYLYRVEALRKVAAR